MRLDPTIHPRPALRRPFGDLDGTWELSLDPDGRWSSPEQVPFDGEIVVPFARETPASGVGDQEPGLRTWYRRTVDVGGGPSGLRHLVHFGAVDRIATVWAGGRVVGRHEGGYTPFAVDITEAARAGDGRVELVVQADDDPRDLDVPRGKQEWQDHPHSIWYPRTSGIWRSVWTETVESTHVAAVDVVADPSAMTLAVRIRVEGPIGGALVAHLRITTEHGRVLVDDRARVTQPEVDRTVTVGDGGIDDRWSLTWWPRRPTLLTVEVGLVDGDDDLDRVESTTALRSVGVEDGRFCINGRPYQLRLALDQGYWPESGATPPSSEALKRDLELARALGFNGVRKHQKTEDPRFFAWADRLGMVAWVEMPSAYRPGPTSAQHLLREWSEVVPAYRTHPSVVAWVPVNESWGVPGLAGDARQRALVESLAAAARALDGTRPVSANDGWETVGGDMVGVHDYDQDAGRLRRRYGSAEALGRFLAGPRPDGRRSDLDLAPAGDRAVLLTEFGGVALASDTEGEGWAYDATKSVDEFVARYRDLWAVVHQSDGLSGACWTQLTDTYQEVNGLLTFDRRPKAPVEELSAATRGRPAP